MQSIRNIAKLNEIELKKGIYEKGSWHDDYKDSAYIYVGGLPYELTEGDLIQMFSQYGEIVDIVLERDKETGKSLGFCFICFEDQRSTVLSVDNLNGIKILDRIIKVDHCRYENKKRRNETDQEFEERIQTRKNHIFPFDFGIQKVTQKLKTQEKESQNSLNVNDPMYEYLTKKHKKRKEKKSKLFKK